jgi:hypothetical protein
MAKFKIKQSTIVRTNLTCPCVWQAVCTENKQIRIEFRLGVLKVYHEERFSVEDSKDIFDITSYIEDEDMLKLLEKNDILEKDTDVKGA